VEQEQEEQQEGERLIPFLENGPTSPARLVPVAERVNQRFLGSTSRPVLQTILTRYQCDGEQPTCSHCRSKGLLCSYDPTPPGTSLLKRKTRLATLETLLASLINTSDHDANSILSQIRTVRDLDALIESGLSEDLSPILRQSRSPSRTHPSPASPPIALFHVFSADQLDYHYQSMSSSEGPPPKISVCVVSAVAAVGLQYLNSVVDDGFRTALYQNARMHLEDVVEESPLDTIKICSVLAMFNVLEKATISLAYIGKEPPSSYTNA
jgi:hypothetical protein